LSANPQTGYYILVNELGDQVLLRDYVQNGSEAAFATLVRRHINFVYSAALRMLLDAHLAEDITQKVFLALVRNAPKLQHCCVLSAWLHRTTRNISAMTVRGEVRRRARETEAALMDHQLSDTKTFWDHLSPLLDDSLLQLSTKDRDALLLRYFERLTAREIAQRLGLSEDAAQKRTVRALEHLRQILSRRGVTITGSTLAAAIGFGSVQSAPAALASSVIATSLLAFASTSTSGIIALMTTTKFATVVAALAAVGLGTVATIEHQNNARLRSQLAARETQMIQVQEAKNQPAAEIMDNNDVAVRRDEHTELLRLRNELALLRQQQQEKRSGLQTQNSSSHAPQPSKGSVEFVPADHWEDVGSATPQNAFQSFMATLKTADPNRIESAIHWELNWKEDTSDEDRRMMDKSKQDYLKMLQLAPGKLSAFNLAPIPQSDSDRKRVFFHLLTTEGTELSSSFEMIQRDGQWKPVLAMGWHNPKDSSSFFTSAMFGPTIDLDR